MKKALLTATAVATALTASLVVAPATTASASAEGTGRHHQAHRSAIPFTEAAVTAATDGSDSFTLTWKAPGIRRVEIRANGRVVARGGVEGRVVVRGLPTADRQWFDFDPDRGEGLHLADRLITLEGTSNFRDAGGYRTSSGQWVRMGEVYRSDALDKLTDADLAKLRRLRVRTVFDLRMEDERAKSPDRVPAGTRHVVADVFAGSGSFQTMPRTPDEAVTAMVEAERAMVGGAGGRQAYTQVLDGVGHDRDHGRSVLFHCTAGKDRTGWASATLLTALGVPRATVEADYLASNEYRKAANDAVLSHLPAAQAAVYKPLLDVRPAYLNAGFDEVRARYGSFDAYLNTGLGVDPRELKQLRQDLLVG